MCTYTSNAHCISFQNICRQLEELREPAEHDRPKPDSFLKIANFDTDLQACLDDPKKALSYQTGNRSLPAVCNNDFRIANVKVSPSSRFSSLCERLYNWFFTNFSKFWSLNIVFLLVDLFLFLKRPFKHSLWFSRSAYRASQITWNFTWRVRNIWWKNIHCDKIWWTCASETDRVELQRSNVQRNVWKTRYASGGTRLRPRNGKNCAQRFTERNNVQDVCGCIKWFW